MHYLIIGCSAAGIAAAQKLRQLDPEASITCITREQELPYNKCLLADYVAGIKKNDEISIITSQTLEAKKIDIRLTTEVTKIDTKQKYIVTHTHEKLFYDKLLIATGARAHVPHVPWLRRHSSIALFHTLADANHIINRCKKSASQRIAIVGAGLSGVELADALHTQGHTVTVIEKNEHILASLLSRSGAEYVEHRMKEQGIAVSTNTHIDQCEFDEASDELQAVRLSNGLHIETDLLVVVTGQKQNSELARDADIQVTDLGIVVDDFLRTSAEDVFAAGDCIQAVDRISDRSMPSCTWPDAMLQGCIAAHNMAGQSRMYSGPSIQITSSFFGLKMAVTMMHPKAEVSSVKLAKGHFELAISNGLVAGYRILDFSNRNAIALKRGLLTGQTAENLLNNIQIENNGLI